MAPAALIEALGLTHLHVAVFDGKLEKVGNLIREDHDVVNTPSSRHKMTALHFAVMLRKFKIACLLIRKKADLTWQDSNGRTPGQYNDEKVRGPYIKLFKKHGYRHEPKVGEHSRHLSSLFRYPVRMRSLLARKRHPLSKTVMFLDKKSVVIAKEIERIPLPELVDRKTYGYIAGPVDTKIDGFALSGWKYSGPVRKVLPNGKFMRLVQAAAKLLDYNLYAQPNDAPGVPSELIDPKDVGRYLASHVEKQLGVYWVLRLLVKYRQTDDISRIVELKEVNLLEHEASATVFIDHLPCDNCWGFLGVLGQATGVSFTVEPVPFVVKGKRQPPSQKLQPNTLSGPRDEEGPEDSDDPVQTLDRVTAAELEPLRQALPHTPVQTLREVARRGDVINTSPPPNWVKFNNDPTVAKPLHGRRERLTAYQVYRQLRPVSGHGISFSSQPDGSQDTSSLTSGVVPVSTINNRSAFFASPSVQPPPALDVQVHQEVDQSSPGVSNRQAPDDEHESPELEVQVYEPSRGWHAPSQRIGSIGDHPSSSISVGSNESDAEVEAISSQPSRKVTIESSKKRLNLSRFRHSPAATVVPRTTTKKRGRPKGSKNKKPSRATVRKESAVRERSAFAQAFRFHMERQQRSHTARKPLARRRHSTFGTSSRSPRSCERICRDTHEYFERHLEEGTLPDNIAPRLCLHGLEMPHYL